MAAAVFSGFIIPWSKDITQIFLGPSYLEGTTALAIMFLYPVHQSLGQINITLLMASSKTKMRLIIGCISMGIGIPVSYFVQASPDALIPGLGFGATGMAWKMVLMQMIIVNLTSWMIARDYEWKFDWIYQVVGLAGFVFLGWLSFAAINMLVTVDSLGLLVRISVHSLLYSVLSGMVIWTLPWLAGMTREGLMSNIAFVLTPNKMK